MPFVKVSRRPTWTLFSRGGGKDGLTHVLMHELVRTLRLCCKDVGLLQRAGLDMMQSTTQTWWHVDGCKCRLETPWDINLKLHGWLLYLPNQLILSLKDRLTPSIPPKMPCSRQIDWSKGQHGRPMCLPDLPRHQLQSSSQCHPWKENNYYNEPGHRTITQIMN